MGRQTEKFGNGNDNCVPVAWHCVPAAWHCVPVIWHGVRGNETQTPITSCKKRSRESNYVTADQSVPNQLLRQSLTLQGPYLRREQINVTTK
jgi:hypothetical protein